MPRIIGTMSGTSADGVDAALVDISDDWPRPSVRFIAHRHHPYPSDLQRRIFAIRQNASVALSELAQLAHDIACQYAAAVNDLLASSHCDPVDIAAVAAHGQTLYHNPPLTLQWLDPALLAHLTGCRVVSDFRRADCAAGGQGAPLVPFADWILFSDPHQPRILLNLGGIANITYLPANASLDQVIAFDTGPANCLSDWLCRTFDPSGPGFDIEGRRAQQGQVIPAIAERFLAAPYFHRPSPKSTDGPEMTSVFQQAILAESSMSNPYCHLNNLLATAAFLTAQTIAAIPHRASQWIISGGGLSNAAIMQQLRRHLPHGTTFQTPDAWNVPSQAREAISFALLAAATLAGVPSNVPSVTGAVGPAILGTIQDAPCQADNWPKAQPMERVKDKA